LKIKTIIAKSSENKKTTNWAPKIRIGNDTDTEEIEAKEMISAPDKNNQSKTTVKKEPRKQVIINNQGSPVIFKFGHERK
jgi:hypothetical protein